jgi:glycerol-3-phosphate dehydrogenase subunit C
MPRSKVAFFAGCYATYNDPDLAEAVVEVLERNGFEVIVPNHRCCGLPLIANGFLDKARDNASHNTDILMKYAEDGIPVVTASPGCGLTIREEYPELFGLPGSQRVAGNLYDISEFLMNLHDKGQLDLDFAPQSGTLAYHAPCHLLALGIGRPSLSLLRLIPGTRVVELPEGCCGIAGTYGFKKEKYEISMAVGQPLFEAAQVSGASRVATDCETCGLQFKHGSGLPSVHPVKVLRDAYR